MIRLLVAAAFIAGSTCAALADFAPPTDAEKEACKHDALMLCSADELMRAWFGDNSGVIACYLANRTKLSNECRAVLRARRIQ